MILTALLGIGFIFALAGDFVLWAKVEEHRHAEQDERENYLAALRLHNTAVKALDRSEEQQRCSAQAVLWYSEQLANAKQEAEGLRMGVDYLGHRGDVLQDKLSSMLCPANNHIWKDGVCSKCGRVQDG